MNQKHSDRRGASHYGESRAAYRNLVIKQCERDNLEDIGVKGGQY